MAQSTTDNSLLPGTEVFARGIRWEVVDTIPVADQTIFRLRGLEGVMQGSEIDLLVPFESVQPVVAEIQPDRATPLRNWLVYHQAFLLEQALGSEALLSIQPGRLVVEPYQLVPVMRALRMSRPRLLLCDGVGLGKTIQAGLVISELFARRLVHRLLIVSPAGPLLDQWRTEFAERFGLRLDVIDRARLEDVRRRNELGTNPFDHIPMGLVSIDFLKQERIVDLLERTGYDIVVIDEAHHCTDLGGAQDREDSQRRRLAEVLARRSDTLLLLTATPHDGHDRSFASLLELLDPSLVDGGGRIRGERYRPFVVRRLKSHIKDPVTGELKFKLRSVLPCPVQVDSVKHRRFMEMQRALLDIVAPELRAAFRARRYSDVLAFIALLKRSVSTVEACEQTLRAVGDRFQRILSESAETQERTRQRRRTLADYSRKLDRYGVLSFEEEQEQLQLEVEDLAQMLASIDRQVRSGSRRLRRLANVVDALDELTDLAAESKGHDPKLDQLIKEISDIRSEEPDANVLVFTEYTDSQEAVAEALSVADMGEVLTMSGEDSDATRQEIKGRFLQYDGIILVSTDTAAEGLNLHQRCHHLIHLELPFNPNRLEQRNGRIDRYGQRFTPVVRYLFLNGTFEERILLKLIAKYEKQRERLTFVPNTLGLTSSSRAGSASLLKGLMDEDERLFQDPGPEFNFNEPDSADSGDPAIDELLEEIDRSLRSFERNTSAHSWLGEAGINANPNLNRQAEEARDRGRRMESVDIVNFVLDAVLLDGGSVNRDEMIEVTLPPAWTYGLEDLPGYDADSRVVRLTTDVEVTRDANDRPVGYLGRAHPLVRRALDRVRNISFGGQSERDQDRRASAVRADVASPHLLLTYLGRVSSGVGREYEQVMAVRLDRDSVIATYDSAEEWIHLADPQKAVRTTDVWKNHFSSWGPEAMQKGRLVASEAFAPLAEEFVNRRVADMEQELSNHRSWVAQRANEIAGEAPVAIQLELGAESAVLEPDVDIHRDPVARLEAFAKDGSNSPSKCAEALSAIRIYNERVADLEKRRALSAPEVQPLGLLMLLPEGSDGA